MNVFSRVSVVTGLWVRWLFRFHTQVASGLACPAGKWSVNVAPMGEQPPALRVFRRGSARLLSDVSQETGKLELAAVCRMEQDACATSVLYDLA